MLSTKRNLLELFISCLLSLRYRLQYINILCSKNNNQISNDTHQTTDVSCVHSDNYVFVLSEISPLKLTLAGYPVHSSDTDILKVMMMMIMMACWCHMPGRAPDDHWGWSPATVLGSGAQMRAAVWVCRAWRCSLCASCVNTAYI